MDLSRRQFFKVSLASLSASSLGAAGLLPATVLAEARSFKLARTTETRNTCPYCSVACGLIMHGMGDRAGNAKSEIIHIEGDPDHPVSRGSLCPKGAGLLEFVHSESRLRYPEYRAPGTDQWQRVSWDWAMEQIARRIKDERDSAFQTHNAAGQEVNRWSSMAFLAASAASNETGYLTNKLARSLGIVMLDSQARICHAPTVAALASSFGRGGMTNTWMDIKNADVILVMGGNAAEAHPVGFKWVMEAKAHRRAMLVVVDPRFTRTAAVADRYAPIRAGSDIAFLNGVIRYLLEKNTIHHDYVKAYTNASLIVGNGYSFNEGLFSGYDATRGEQPYDRSQWLYAKDANGMVLSDPTMRHPSCVINLLREHVAAYTSDMVSNLTGTPEDEFIAICEIMASTADPGRSMTSLYALGWTHHSVGVQNIRAMSMIQMLLGNIGISGGGMNALRGHSNIQGLSDLGLLTDMLPGYMTLPKDEETTRSLYLEKRTPKALRLGQWNIWSAYPAYHTSLMKAWYGPAASASNDYGYRWLPKLDKPYDSMRFFDLMAQGKVRGFVCQGFNPLASYPNKDKLQTALASLKFMIVMDPLATETSNFWQNHGAHHPVNSSEIQTEVFRLPTTCFAEEDGSLVNSSRWLQWHWKGAEPPGEARTDIAILGDLFLRLRTLYAKEGGAFADPILNLYWPYTNPEEPTPEELAREYNGYAITNLKDSSAPDGLIRAGQQLSSYGQLRDDGSTASGNWIFCGAWTEAGNQMARRETHDEGDRGLAPGWAWAWPANRRILYNRASCDPQGKPWNEKKALIRWDGSHWHGLDVPDFPVSEAPGSPMSPFVMNPEGLARLYAVDRLADGPFPQHYEPFESPLAAHPLHPKVIDNPAARIFPGDRSMLGSVEDYPYVATTYRITEHFNCWTTHNRINASLQPEQFVEIGAVLAHQLGIMNGDMVVVRSARGMIKAVAMVTRRIRPITVNGDWVHQIGIPVHWGFQGLTRKGYFANNLTPYVGDANTQTPEFKAFLVNIEKDMSEFMPHTHKPGEEHEERRQAKGWFARNSQGINGGLNMSTASIDILQRSATTSPPPQQRKTLEVAKLIDISKCIGCKACQSACQEWNDLRETVGVNEGSYQNPHDLTENSWTLMRFTETEANGPLEWLIRKDGCMHCAEPGCLKACPSPGAILQFSNGIVDFQQDQCIGCGYCIAGCPFNIPRISGKDQKAYKCTLCSDRVNVGLEPACVKSCPTQALVFGSKDDMIAHAEMRITDLKDRGYVKAGLYNPQGVGGTHVMYVLQHADQPDIYSHLPADPRISPTVSLWKGLAKPVALAAIFLTILTGWFHYLTVGPNVVGEENDDEEAV